MTRQHRLRAQPRRSDDPSSELQSDARPGRAIGRGPKSRDKAARHHLACALLLAALPASLGGATIVQAKPIRYTLEATVDQFSDADPANLKGKRVTIVYEFDDSTAQSTLISLGDGQGNTTNTRNYFNGLTGVNSTKATLTVAGSSYPGTVVTQWTFVNSSGPNPGL